MLQKIAIIPLRTESEQFLSLIFIALNFCTESNQFRMEGLFPFNELLEKNDNLWMFIYQYLFTSDLKNI